MMLEAVVAVLVVAVAVLAVLLARRPAPAQDPQMAALRNELSILRETSQQSSRIMNEAFDRQLQSMGSNVQTALAGVRTEVSGHLEAMNQNVARRLNENVQAMRETSGSVGDRIAGVQATFAELKKEIGGLSEQARQLSETSKVMADLQRIFSAPKLRGGFGEAQLDALLSQVFAREQFQLQYQFSSGDIADAVIHFPMGRVAIDSKFPLENFRRVLEATGDAERKAARREFLKDVKRRVDEIAARYIRPADGTLPFALAYIPAENVYYEAIIRDEDGNDLYQYCIERRVFPVSPNSLYAYLQTIVVGMSGMRISQRAQSILRELDTLRHELEKLDEIYGTLGQHLKNAVARFDDGSRALDRLEGRVNALAGTGMPLFDEIERKQELASATPEPEPEKLFPTSPRLRN
ncbi:MAG: DNA recombination protein RmuC [Terriglobales bacterium]